MNEAPRTGPEAIYNALRSLDLQKVEEKQRNTIRAGSKTKRPDAVKILNTLEGLKRNDIRPEQLMIKNVPVIPAKFRPFAVVGNTFTPGDANELYKDLHDLRSAYNEERGVFGDEGSGDARLNLYDAVRAVYGYTDPVKPKTKSRGVSGFLKKITGCHDDTTEILTKDGWVLFDDLVRNAEVATINPDSMEFEWQMPTDYQKYRYQGEMVRFYKKNRIDMLVTPSHRMWNRVRPGREAALTHESVLDKWIICKAWELAPNGNRIWYQTAAINWDGEYESPAWAEGIKSDTVAGLVGFYLAEGWLKRDNAIQLCQCPDENPRYCEWIRGLLRDSGLEWKEECLQCEPSGFNTRQHTQIRWTINCSAMNKWLRENCGHGSHDKRISKEIREWPSEMLGFLLGGYLRGDGTKRDRTLTREAHAHKFIGELGNEHEGFCTVSRKLFEGLSAIAPKIGITIYERPYEGKDGIILGTLVARWNTYGEGGIASMEDYDGFVYCCTVPNGLLITRRNSHVVVSGNSNPKFGYVQRKLIGKTQDSVARGTISVDPELSLDEIGVPEDMAWTMYAPYIQRRLVQSGVSARDALIAVRDRTDHARKALDREVTTRPVIYARSPSWHRFNVIAGRPKLIKGNSIGINPLVTTGLNADFDGDQMNLHVPSQDDAVKEAWDVLMPSKMLFSIRDPEKIIPALKHEQVQGLYTAQARSAKSAHVFPDENSAIAAIRGGNIALSDEIHILDPRFEGNKPAVTG